MPKEKPIKLRSMDWPDLIVYFTNLRYGQSITAKDIVDYFRFRTLNGMGIERWATPDYRVQTASAKKLLDLYGEDFTLELIDTLFESYKTVTGKEFGAISWSLGILSSEKTGWMMERLFKVYYDKKSLGDTEAIKRLLAKPRSTWTQEERMFFEQTIKGETNG